MRLPRIGDIINLTLEDDRLHRGGQCVVIAPPKKGEPGQSNDNPLFRVVNPHQSVFWVYVHTPCSWEILPQPVTLSEIKFSRLEATQLQAWLNIQLGRESDLVGTTAAAVEKLHNALVAAIETQPEFK